MEPIFDRSLESEGGEWPVNQQRLSWDVLDMFGKAATETKRLTTTDVRAAARQRSCARSSMNCRSFRAYDSLMVAATCCSTLTLGMLSR